MRLIVCPLHGLDKALAARPSHAVSLISPDAETPEISIPHRLILRFNDIHQPVAGLTHVLRENIEDLIGFAKTWDGKMPLLLHCWAGISRSTAAAYIIACLHNPDENFVASRLREVAPEATPNPLMIAIADKILRRDGRMDRAIKNIGRGREAPHGDNFELNI
jgi:predicted protein tyrosine phosphatase